MEPLPLTFDDAEQMYANIMSLVSDLLASCDAHVSDPHVEEIYKQIDFAVRDIYAYASPP